MEKKEKENSTLEKAIKWNSTKKKPSEEKSINTSTDISQSNQLDKKDIGDAYIERKQQLQSEEKEFLAKYIVEKYIEDLSSVAIDAGSTSQKIIEHMMLDKKFLSILTNNMTAFRQNSKQNVDRTANEFILTGGKYVALFDAILGNETLNSFELFHPHVVIIGASGFIPNKGFFCHGNDEKSVKTLLFNKQNVSSIIIPVDFTKLGRSDSYLFGEAENFKNRELSKCIVVLIPPVPPKSPKRTGDDNDDKTNKEIYDKLRQEYEKKKKEYELKKKKLNLEKSGIEFEEIEIN
jgi:DeoR/GlpR family transcriptional regulator of sugar metabolism